MDLSIVIPCLNEGDTIALCVANALRTVSQLGRESELIVADNGSTDGSQALATAGGARLVSTQTRGYGAALIAGLNAARGRYLFIADADDSYDFGEIPRFLDQLQTGKDLVLGCRFPSGGGSIRPGAMPFLHRWLGNPAFSLVVRWWFHVPIHDVNCGMRALTIDLFRRLNQRCHGMEFAVEMVIKAAHLKANIAEVPITLRRDGRRHRAPHLRMFRDGWKTLRLILQLKWQAPLFPESGIHPN
jgi:glycosyltransferase involved in cell wall biosynthesis